MSDKRSASLRLKIRAVSLVTSAAGLVFACASFHTYDVIAYRRVLERSLETLAVIVGQQCTAAIRFNDPEAARENLDALAADPNLWEAALYTSAGRVLARFAHPEAPVPPSSGPGADGVRWGGKAFSATVPVLHDGERIGTVHLRMNADVLWSRLRRNVSAALLILAVMLAGAVILSDRLARKVTEPILHLAGVVRDVSVRKDYSVRVRGESEGEIGALFQGFNEMLEQIQSRDTELRKAREELEHKVRERTSELSRANEALRVAEARYRELVDSVQAIVWRADAGSLRFTFVNPEAEKILGYPLRQWIEEPSFWIDHLHPEDRSWVMETCRRATAEGRDHHMDYRMLARDGRVVWFRDIVRVIGEPGAPRELVGVMFDITAQREAEEARRRSEERYRFLFESSPDAILIVRNGTIELANPAAATLFGAEDPARLAGRSLSDLAASSTSAEKLSQILGSGKAVTAVEDRWRRLDGRLVEVEFGAASFVSPDGIQTQILARDISRRKEMDRMKSEFVSTVSHELRTPLTSIRGALGLLAGGAVGKLPPEGERLIGIALNNSVRLVSLINDILDIEKIAAGKMEFHFRPLDVDGLIDQGIESNRSYAESFGVRLVRVGAPTHARISADSNRLMQVLANLLSNAVKFSPRGETVEILSGREGGRVWFAVRDHGPGIPRHFRHRVFERFAQADGSDSRQKGGTGLGLAITKAIVERHGGTIRFETEEGKGTTFIVELPELEARKDSTVRRTGPGRWRLLLCEDQPDVADIMATALERKLGADVTVAPTAGDARRILEKERFDALLLDLILPDEDGLSFLRSLRARPETRDLVTIVVSAIAGRARGEVDGAALWVADWLEKPVDPAHLAESVRRVLRQARAGTPPRVLHVEDDPDTRRLVAIGLGDSVEVVGAAGLEEARRTLEESGPFDLAVVDVGLPDGSGLDLLPELTGIPVILFSAREVSVESSQVVAALVKSRASHEDLVQMISQCLFKESSRGEKQNPVCR